MITNNIQVQHIQHMHTWCIKVLLLCLIQGVSSLNHINETLEQNSHKHKIRNNCGCYLTILLKEGFKWGFHLKSSFNRLFQTHLYLDVGFRDCSEIFKFDVYPMYTGHVDSWALPCLCAVKPKHIVASHALARWIHSRYLLNKSPTGYIQKSLIYAPV